MRLPADLEHKFARFCAERGLDRTLQARLAPWLRRAAAEPAAAFVHLALCALDLERLRGELLRRALFPQISLAVAEAA